MVAPIFPTRSDHHRCKSSQVLCHICALYSAQLLSPITRQRFRQCHSFKYHHSRFLETIRAGTPTQYELAQQVIAYSGSSFPVRDQAEQLCRQLSESTQEEYRTRLCETVNLKVSGFPVELRNYVQHTHVPFLLSRTRLSSIHVQFRGDRSGWAVTLPRTGATDAVQSCRKSGSVRLSSRSASRWRLNSSISTSYS